MLQPIHPVFGDLFLKGVAALGLLVVLGLLLDVWWEKRKARLFREWLEGRLPQPPGQVTTLRGFFKKCRWKFVLPALCLVVVVVVRVRENSNGLGQDSAEPADSAAYDANVHGGRGDLFKPVRGTAASVSGARQLTTKGWQPIVFSSSEQSVVSSNVTVNPAKPSSAWGLLDWLRTYQDAAPVIPDTAPLPAAPLPSLMRRISKSSADHQQWVFMTPAQIMGVTPSQILQTEYRRTPDEQAAPTAMERKLGGGIPSSATFQSFSPPAEDSWASGNSATNSLSDFGAEFAGGSPTTPQADAPSLFEEPVASQNAFASTNENWDWSQLTAFPAVAEDSTEPEQDDLRQFRKLLGQHFAPGTADTSVPGDTNSVAETTLSGFSQSTGLWTNSIGGSLGPLRSGIGRPIGLGPLPAITGHASAGITTSAGGKPAWGWSTPSPFAMPQRQF